MARTGDSVKAGVAAQFAGSGMSRREFCERHGLALTTLDYYRYRERRAGALHGITQTTGLNGEQLSTSYDGNGRPLTSTSPYGAVTTYAYSGAGTVPGWQTKSGPDGFTKTTLDGLGRTIKVERGPSSASITSKVDTVYAPCACSPLGKLSQVSQPYAPGGTPVWTTYTYDGIGRTLSVQQPDGVSTTGYSYSGNQTTVTDPAGKWKTFTSDVEGNLVTVTEPNPAGGTLSTSYTYDWMKHLVGVSMVRGAVTQTRSFVYDDSGRLTSATNPENGTVQYYYNADNTLQYKRDAKGQDTVYTYDTQKRTTMMQRYPLGQTNAEDQCQRVTYSYDTNPVNAGFSLYAAGRLTAAQYSVCAGGQTTAMAELYSYHPAGAVTAKQMQTSRYAYDPGTGYGGMATGAAEADYSYDSAGRTVSYQVQFPTGDPALTPHPTIYTYGFDAMGRSTSLTDNMAGWAGANTQWVQNAAFDAAGRQTSLQLYVGAASPQYTTESRSYNANGQVTDLTWTASSLSGFSVTGGLHYTYPGSNNGQISQMADSVSGETVSYAYDSLKRLVSASSSASWSQSYGFDGFGNLTSLGATSIAVNGATNQLTNAVYDLNGNMTSGSGTTLTYDEANRVASAKTTAGGSATEYYGYAPDNKRIYKLRTDGVEEWTFYGARGEKLYGAMQMSSGGIYDNTGTRELGLALYFTGGKKNVWFGGRLLWEGTSPVLQDRLGTNRAGGAKYYPYGGEITSTANDSVKFGTYTRDSFTGLDYADQRFYASSYGRFNTADPYRASAGAKDPGSWNRYAYAGGDPINYNDPRGLARCHVVGWTTTRPDSDDALKEVTTAEIQCTSAGGDILKVILSPFSGDIRGAEREAEAYFGRDLDLAERKGRISWLASKVRSGAESDCNALADYADFVAGGEYSGDIRNEMKSAFALLTPSQFPVYLIPGISGNSTYQALNASQATSGFQSQFQDQIPNADQAHHFSAFFQLGFSYGDGVAATAATWWEKLEGTSANVGDVNLGQAAARIGAYVASGVLPASQVGQTIRENLCK